MNRQDRAKLFAPFEALNGLRAALKEKERLNERQYETQSKKSHERDLLSAEVRRQALK